MTSWLKTNWKRIAGVACGAAAVVLHPIQAEASAALAAACGAAFGSDAALGRAIANRVRDALGVKRKDP